MSDLLRPSHRSAIQRHQIAAFLVLTFAWTWTIWAVGIALGYGGTRWIQVVGAWGPLIGATVVTKASGGDVRAWAAQVVPNRGVKLRWYGLAFAAPFALTQTAVTIGWLIGEPVTLVDTTEIIVAFAVTLFVAGALEEFGWRGFLQPRLQERRSALFAAVIVGVVWWLWHVPLLFGGTGAGYESGEAIALLIGLPLFSIVMAWIYNSTRGGLLFVMLFHATINTTPVLETDAATAVMGLGELAVLIGLPLFIVLYYGREYLAAASPEPPIPGHRP